LSERLLRLSQRICDELEELERMVQRAREGWRRAEARSDDLYLDGVALNLHSFYSGLERLFQLIATAIDGSMPEGANWHQALLEQMAQELPGVRPAVLSQATREALDEYRGFRHVVRHVYAFRLDAVRMRPLVQDIPGVWSHVRSELMAFSRFLKQNTTSP
jgi:hypothetical protein